MSSELIMALYQRNMWRNKHFKVRSNKEFRLKYTQWWNRVVSVKNASLRKYFSQQSSRSNHKDFYKMVKPFFSDKNNNTDSKLFLRENDSIISDPIQVAEIFNAYYVSLAEYKCEYDGLDCLDLDQAISKHANH